MQIIKIGSSWCSGCIIMRPIWEEIEKEIEINTQYYDYDIYEDILKEKYNIGDKLPIAIFLDDKNEEITRINGETTKDKILEIIRSNS